MFVVDKDSGEVTNFHPKFSPYTPALTFDSLSVLKEVKVPISPVQSAAYLVASVEEYLCPVEGSKRCTKDGKLFLITTTTGRHLYATTSDAPDSSEMGGLKLGFITDPAFVAKATEQLVNNDEDVLSHAEVLENHRHLLHYGSMDHCYSTHDFWWCVEWES
mmetsp:Transcript_5578/g.6417  ORF Transcript_5578/g.6417 Transcript_5578/m.6417 type:complete len:161 (+) Transcript_5578:122-604(+)